MTAPPQLSEDALETGRRLCLGPVRFVLGAANLGQLPQGDRPEIAFAGRSNVGKSSLINAVLNRKSLARTSAEPGKTRELNYYDLGEGRLWLVDLPGFGYAKVSRQQTAKWIALTRQYLRGRASLRRVFLLIDSRRGFMESDLEIMRELDTAAVNYQIVLTKSDKMKTTALEQLNQTMEDTLKKHPAAHPNVLMTSSEKGIGIAELRAEIGQMAGG